MLAPQEGWHECEHGVALSRVHITDAPVLVAHMGFMYGDTTGTIPVQLWPACVSHLRTDVTPPTYTCTFVL